ncbi:MAG: ADP-ribosylglycohydrolase family protein [Armatimonadota bacterium]|nr:ADP-ribosylglycohydrolase family protein [Armatimonadota bacterium]MDR7506485.1 ADP-ribosylglycohydrolase family protein [Armatimonadota bacterium]MDR7509850.1 ADP-ribosylglycohydrolase family protein [Armatimonadota bacterium]
MVTDLHDRILGSLAAGVIGDAMGAATEQRSYEEIISLFGGPVREFVPPPPDSPFAGGRDAGQITDDSGQMLAMAEALIATGGRLTVNAVAQHLLRWADDPEVFRRFAGPTTRAAIEELRRGTDPRVVGRQGKLTSMGTSNGAAMRVAPAGLVHPGDLEGAIRDAVTMCLPSHATQLAMSGACAVAAGVARALTLDADVYAVVQAAFHGALRGEEIGRREGRVVAGPSVYRRMELAVGLAVRHRSVLDAIRDIHAYVGSGLHIAEAVPAAIGIFVAACGDPLEAIVGGVNIGDDTDTVAIIAGSLAGALRGTRAIPGRLIEQVERANQLNLDRVAAALTAIARGGSA